jgi:hypothetical protein
MSYVPLKSTATSTHAINYEYVTVTGHYRTRSRKKRKLSITRQPGRVLSCS